LGISSVEDYQEFLEKIEEISAEYDYDDIWEIKENVRKVGFNILTKDILKDIGKLGNWDYLSQDNIKGFIKNVGDDWLYQIAYFKEIDNSYEISSDIKEKNQKIVDQFAGQTLKSDAAKNNLEENWWSFQDKFVDMSKKYSQGQVNEIKKEDLINILPKRVEQNNT
jgi:hypothetical protein